MSKEKIQALKKKIRLVAEGSKMNYIALFGSHARGDENASSDIDLLVRFGEPVTFIEVLDIEEQLSELLNRKVDLVTERSLSPYFKPYVIKDLKVLYERG